ncbi:Vitamin K epoxide reductase [Thermodesulfovibrio sp. N1]|nr:Vitamin K epoxide reductase [Thermodesulfovibrio sp. N1]
MILTTVEFIFQLIGKSLCQTEGCRIVESFVKGGDIVLLIFGIFLFTILFFLSFKKGQKADYSHSLILIIALTVEGYLLGFQSFILKEFCVFCLTIFGFLFIATIYRFMQGRRELIYAFVCFLAVFFIIYIVNPQINEFPSSRYVLVYSKDCPYCNEIIKFCEQFSIPVKTIEANEIGGILKSLKINSVPVLFYNDDLEKKFIIGNDNIKTYLLTKVTPQQNSSEVCPIFAPSECK